MTNYVNIMQEILQAKAPSLGCQCQDLWEYDDKQVAEQLFQVRIILKNTIRGGEWPMPWSDIFNNKKSAKQDAARKAITILSSENPHDPNAVPLTVREHNHTSHCRTPPTAGVQINFSLDEPRLSDLLKPSILAGLVAMELTAASKDKEKTINCAALSLSCNPESDNEEIDSEEDLDWLGLEADDNAARSLPPDNLGRLGEDFAFRWLQEQAWVRRASVVWLNADHDAAADHDLDCELAHAAGPGRRCVEVKTRWAARRRTAASRRQLARLLDPEDDYILLVLTHFSRLFAAPPSLPAVAIFCSPRTVSTPPAWPALPQLPASHALPPPPDLAAAAAGTERAGDSDRADSCSGALLAGGGGPGGEGGREGDAAGGAGARGRRGRAAVWYTYSTR